MTALRRLALLTAVGTYLLIVVGAIVRSTGSGLGCPDWPLCHGQFVPPPQVTAWIEFSHRFTGAIVSALILAMVAAAWVWAKNVRHIVWPATAVPIMLAAQITLGAWVVWLDTQTLAVMVHLSFAFVIMGFVLWVNIAARVAANGGLALADDGPSSGVRLTRASLAGYWRLVLTLTGVTYLLLIVGGFTRAFGAGWVCSGFPLCNGQLAPFGSSPLVDLHLTHRLLGFVVAALIFWLAWKTSKMSGLPPALKRVAYSLVAIVIAQITIGAVAVVVGPALVMQQVQGMQNASASAAGNPVAAPLWILQTLHVAGASAVWSMVVVLIVLSIVALVKVYTHNAESYSLTPSLSWFWPGGMDFGTVIAPGPAASRIFGEPGTSRITIELLAVTLTTNLWRVRSLISTPIPLEFRAPDRFQPPSRVDDRC